MKNLKLRAVDHIDAWFSRRIKTSPSTGEVTKRTAPQLDERCLYVPLLAAHRKSLPIPVEFYPEPRTQWAAQFLACF